MDYEEGQMLPYNLNVRGNTAVVTIDTAGPNSAAVLRKGHDGRWRETPLKHIPRHRQFNSSAVATKDELICQAQRKSDQSIVAIVVKTLRRSKTRMSTAPSGRVCVTHQTQAFKHF